MTAVYNLTAFNNCTFHLSRDFSLLVPVYAIATGVLRMQARISPLSAAVAYEWNSTNTSGGMIAFNAATNICVFGAPLGDLIGMSNALYYDCRLELPTGAEIVLFKGRIRWKQGVTRSVSDAAATASGMALTMDTVSVDNERVAAPVPLP